MDINVKLDINKAGQFINEPVTMRVGESDNVIKASIFKDGTPYTGFKTATFNTTRSSGSVIANDPATVSGNTVSYSVAPTVTNNIGKLRNSYFLLDGKTSTESFEVAILPGVSADGDITDYVPGLSGLQDKWAKVSADWDTKINGIKKEIENVSISDELKTAMNAAIDSAKKEYMATFNEAVKSIDDTAKSLQDKQTVAASELDKTIADAKAKGDSAADSVDSNIKSLNDKSKDIDTAVAAVNSKITDVDDFLANVQSSITAANSKFTSDQETSVKAVLDELKTQIENTKTDADSLAKQIADIQAAVDSFDMPQVTADTKEALETAKGASDKIDGLKVGGRNYALNSYDYSGGAWLRATDSFGVALDDVAFGTKIYQSSGNWAGPKYKISYLQKLVPIGTKLTISEYIRTISDGVEVTVGFYGAGDKQHNVDIATNDWKKIKYSFTLISTEGDTVRLETHGFDANVDSTVQFAGFKIERGNIATDYTPAPEDKLNVSDTANWQKSKITHDDNGDFITVIQKAGDQDSLLKNASGTNTFLVAGDNPQNETGKPLRGISIKGADGVGAAIGIDYFSGNTYVKGSSKVNDTITGWKQLATTSDLPDISNLASKSDISGLAKQSDIPTVPVTGATLNGKDVPIVDKKLNIVDNKLNIVTGTDDDTIEPGTMLYDSKWHWDYTQKKVVFDSESGTKTPDVSNVRNGIYLGLADNTALNKQDVYQYALLSANFAQSKNFYCQTNAVGDDPAEDKNVWIKIPKLDLLYSNDLETHLNKASNEKYINNEMGAFSTISLMLFFRPIGMTNSLVGDTPNSTEQYTDPGPFLESPKQMCLSLSRSENNKIGSFSSPQFGIPIPNDTAGKTVVLNTPVITQIIAY